MLRRLRADQGPFIPGPRLPILDELIATVLSQHTSGRNSERAFARLKATFPDWDAYNLGDTDTDPGPPPARLIDMRQRPTTPDSSIDRALRAAWSLAAATKP